MFSRRIPSDFSLNSLAEQVARIRDAGWPLLDLTVSNPTRVGLPGLPPLRFDPSLDWDYDPHPAEGVRAPLSRTVANFRFVLLADCGHTPWHERRAREEFYRVLEQELASR